MPVGSDGVRNRKESLTSGVSDKNVSRIIDAHLRCILMRLQFCHYCNQHEKANSSKSRLEVILHPSRVTEAVNFSSFDLPYFQRCFIAVYAKMRRLALNTWILLGYSTTQTGKQDNAQHKRKSVAIVRSDKSQTSWRYLKTNSIMYTEYRSRIYVT